MRKGRVFTVLANGRRDVSQPRTPIVLQNEDGTLFKSAGDAEGWHNIPTSAMSNGWSASGPSTPPQYRKRPDGVVELRGQFCPGTGGQTIFTLPAGYRHNHSEDLTFPACGQGGVCVGIIVQADGAVKSLGTVNSLFFIDASAVRYSVN